MPKIKSRGPSAPRRRPLHCSFCGTSSANVARLIAGPTVYICDECIGVCCDLLANRPLRETRVLVQRLVFPSLEGGAPIVECQLCRGEAGEGNRLWIGDRGWVCKLCVDLIRGMPQPPRPRLVPPPEK